jgi:C-terminal processing protease CtpA/Prc
MRTIHSMTFVMFAALAVFSALAADPPLPPPEPPAPAPAGSPDAPPPAAAPEAPDEPWLGVLIGETDEQGTRVVAVLPGGPAERAGLRPGDLLLRAGERPLGDEDALEAVLDRLRPGQALSVVVVRDGVIEEHQVVLGRREPMFMDVTPPAIELPPIVRHALCAGDACSSWGLQVSELTDDLRRHFAAPAGQGVLVVRVEPDSLAARRGLAVGDILLAIGAERVAAAETIVGTRGLEAIELVRGRQHVRLEPLEPRLDGAEALRRQALLAEMERLRERLAELERQLERERADR